MKSYEVEFARRAVEDFDEALLWYRERSDEVASKWIAAVEAALDALEHNPQRFPKAREHGVIPAAIRECSIGGGRRATHRMIFVIRPDKVVVHAIHHLSRKDLTAEDLAGG